MKTFLYFRTEAAVADDDGSGNSVLFPSESFVGAEMASDTSLVLSFQNSKRPSGHGNSLVLDNAANLPLVDTVALNITANKGREVLEGIVGAINKNLNSGFVVVGDDAADSAGGTQYIHPDITSVGTITINAAYVNA
tara:strand:- start:50 stop:460 length:411 start_codon:yes stop_codon:yes gene_type:complete